MEREGEKKKERGRYLIHVGIKYASFSDMFFPSNENYNNLVKSSIIDN